MPKTGKASPAPTPRAGSPAVWVLYGNNQKMLLNSDVNAMQLMEHLCHAAVAGVNKMALVKKTDFRAQLTNINVQLKELEAIHGADHEEDGKEDAKEEEDPREALVEEKKQLEESMKALEAGVEMFEGLKSWQHVGLCGPDGSTVLLADDSNRRVSARTVLKPNAVYTLGRRVEDGDAGKCDLLVFS